MPPAQNENSVLRRQMGKPKKAVPIRKRAQGSTQGKTEQKKRGNAGGAKQGARKSERGWGCASVVDNQAAGIVGKVLGAAEHKSRGVNLRSLTLAPGVKAKKATHAVVCQTLKCKWRTVLVRCSEFISY